MHKKIEKEIGNETKYKWKAHWYMRNDGEILMQFENWSQASMFIFISLSKVVQNKIIL